MKIQEVRRLLNSESGLEEILTEYQPCFDTIDELMGYLKQDILNGEKELLSAQTTLTGLYGSLITIFKIAQAYKISEEAKQFVLLNEDYEKNNPGIKSLSAAKLDKLTAIKIANWRTLRNIFEGYILAAEKAIITCQSNLKSLKMERAFSNTNPEKF